MTSAVVVTAGILWAFVMGFFVCWVNMVHLPRKKFKKRMKESGLCVDTFRKVR